MVSASLSLEIIAGGGGGGGGRLAETALGPLFMPGTLVVASVCIMQKNPQKLDTAVVVVAKIARPSVLPVGEQQQAVLDSSTAVLLYRQ